MQTASMQALTVCSDTGGLSYHLQPESVPMPVPQADEVLIQVAYAGVNRADQWQAVGRYPLPAGANARLGLEVSGKVVAIGSHVTSVTLQDRVAALTEGGGYAEYVVVPASHIISDLQVLSLQEMAAVPEAAAASWFALIGKGQLRAGETVLIQGAAGNIGPFMVQLAGALGAKVLATAGTDEKCAWLAQWGAVAINYRAQAVKEQVMRHTSGQGVDVIIDPIGASAAMDHLAMLRFGGRLVTIGFFGGNKVEALPIGKLLTKNLSWMGFGLRGLPMAMKADIMQKVRETVVPLLENGQIKPVIDSVFAFTQADKAHARMQQRLHCGKILLEVQTL